ncbi:MAG: phage scaffolding protein [Eubacterium sp.]|nr:phage scaffolding protein [Eubacterium sp.]
MKEKLMKIGLPQETIKEVMNLMTTEITKLKNEHQTQINNIKLENEIEKAMTSYGAKTTKAVRALLNTDEIKFDDNGNITGINQQLDKLINDESTKYLFNNKEDINFSGVNIGTSNDDNKSFENMSYEEICDFLKE